MDLKKKGFSFPTAFTVLFIVLMLSCILTYAIPAGSYSKLKYDADDSGKNEFTLTKPDGSSEILPATQDVLDNLGIKANLEKFINKDIKKPISIPNTYEKLEQNPQGVVPFITSSIKGVYDSIDIILFVLVLGGIIGILDYSGAFNAGIAALSRATRGREYILIIFVTFLISLGGTTFGLAEETIALYPILVPIFIAAKYDVMVCIGAIYMGSSIGTMMSTVNPFSTVIASNAAGINFVDGLTFRFIGLILGTGITIAYILRYGSKIRKDPSKSIVYEEREKIAQKFEHSGEAPALTTRFKIALLLFLLSFIVMIWGVALQGWWFEEMTALFLVAAVIIGIALKIPEKIFVSKFISGAGELIGVGLIIGVARAVNIILETGNISDTILHTLSGVVQGFNPWLFIIIMMLIFVILGFFVSSSSGLATLSIPIIAPLADAVGLPRDIIITAYLFGLGIISFITPTGLILATLDMVDVTYNKWLKFVMPLIFILTALSIILLLIQVTISV